MATARDIKKKITKVEKEIAKNLKAQKRLGARHGKLAKAAAKVEKPLTKLENETLVNLKDKLKAIEDKAAGKKGVKGGRRAKAAPPAPESSNNVEETAEESDDS